MTFIRNYFFLVVVMKTLFFTVMIDVAQIRCWEFIDYMQNFVLFPNMDLEILCRFLFESGELIFDTPKKFVWMEIFSTYFLLLWSETESWNVCSYTSL
jgi:hypothetical protein